MLCRCFIACKTMVRAQHSFGGRTRGTRTQASRHIRNNVPDTEKWPPPNNGSSSTTRLPRTRFTAGGQRTRTNHIGQDPSRRSSGTWQASPPTNDSGQGKSNTWPRQLDEKISDTVMHCCSDAHHAHSSRPAQPSQPSAVYTWQVGATAHRGDQSHAPHQVRNAADHMKIARWRHGARRAPTARDNAAFATALPGHMPASMTQLGHGDPSEGPVISPSAH